MHVVKSLQNCIHSHNKITNKQVGDETPRLVQMSLPWQQRSAPHASLCVHRLPVAAITHVCVRVCPMAAPVNGPIKFWEVNFGR